MAIKIRVKSSGGKAKASSVKTTAKRTTATKGRGSTKGRTTTTHKSTAAAAKKQTNQPSPHAKAKAAAIKEHERALTTAGKNVTTTREAHEEAVNELYEVAQAAIEGGVPMTVVSDKTGISRQWLYKMGEHRSRNGSAPAKRSSRKRTAAKSSAKASSGAKRTRTTAKKRSSSKRRSVKVTRKR